MENEEPLFGDVSTNESVKVVRKLRKKLRQIERLEKTERGLTDEEKLKLCAKDDIRGQLQKLLKSINRREESFNSSAASNDVNGSSDEDNEECASFSDPQENSEQPPTDTKRSDEDNPPEGDSLHKTPHQPLEIPEKDPGHTSKKGKTPKFRSKLRKLWKNKSFAVSAFTGHNDVVCDVAACSGWLVSASRDTSAKLWEISTKREIRHLSGHTGSITSLHLLSQEESDRFRSMIVADSDKELMHDLSVKEYPQELLLLSASTDCYIKLWLLPQGCCIKSIYTFSPITSICFFGQVVFAGTDSGKLIAYHVTSGEQLCETIAHNDTVTTLKYQPPSLASASTDGDLKLWDVEPSALEASRPNVDLKCKFALKDTEHHIAGRQILCLQFHENFLFYGDDGVNLKVLDLHQGTVDKYANHKSYGFTDFCSVISDLLFTSSFDLDTGVGSINVRSISGDPPMTYAATLELAELPRLACVAIDPTHSGTCFFTGGSQLLMWKEVNPSKHDESCSLDKDGVAYLKGKSIAELGKSFTPSDVESETSETEAEPSHWWWSKPVETSPKRETVNEDSDTDSDDSETSHTKTELVQSSWLSWCSVV